MELKELWRKQKLKGVFVQTVDSPAMPLIAQRAGMDFIFYDCEHGSFTYDKLTNLILLGNGRGFPSIVRVAQLARADVSGILDCGASGVMVPMMETKSRQSSWWAGVNIRRRGSEAILVDLIRILVQAEIMNIA